ncbi:putative metal-binding motif-containing protein [Myxococcota bacterium]|nr:putative metal-binding motif-containing protein [Myxococcota bacterium]
MALPWKPLALAALAALMSACTAPPEDDPDDADGDGVSASEDCDDGDPSVSPLAAEQCDGKDNDCDGDTDEGFDFDQDGFLTADAASGCLGTAATLDCRDGDPDVHPGATEICNDIDDDCNDVVDDVPDGDVDGFTSCEGDCDDADTSTHPDAFETCDGEDNDCDGFIDEDYDADADGVPFCSGDCDDEDADVFPGAMEICNGIDDDCDGVIDPGFDEDGDGWTTCGGDCDDGDDDRYPGAGEVCNDIDDDCDGDADDGFDLDSDGYLTCGDPPDCDDLDPGTRPGGVEVCDGKDNDCDGETDEGFAGDTDGDGYGYCDGDCDDSDPAIHPGAVEVCNGGIDDDCDYTTSEGEDADGDGVDNCSGDCDLLDSTVYPGAPELCDGQDNDCDGSVAPGEEDVDGDGVPVCAGDCDDDDAGIRPGAVEDTGNGIDDDCDDAVDEETTVSGYAVASSFLLTSEIGVLTFDTAGTALASHRMAGTTPGALEATGDGTFILVNDGDLVEVDPDAGTAVPVAVVGLGMEQPLRLARRPGGGYALITQTRLWLVDEDWEATVLAEFATLTLMDVEVDGSGRIVVADALGGIYDVNPWSGAVSERPITLAPWVALTGIGVEPDGDVVGVGPTAGVFPGLYRITPDGAAWSIVPTFGDALAMGELEVDPVSGNYLLLCPFWLGGGGLFGAALLEVTPSGTYAELVTGATLGTPGGLAVIP